MNVQKSVAFLCTNNETAEKEIKETIPCTIAPKGIKHLGGKGLVSKNCEALMKEIEDDTKKIFSAFKSHLLNFKFQ